MKKHFAWALCFVTQIGFAADTLKIEFPVEKFILKNGLTVLLAKDSSVPLVSYHTWYRVGSRDEGPGYTGAAHMLEHMMFKGAKKYDGKQLEKIWQANGVVNNAFTSFDYTGFFEKLPSSKLELIMDMEVDRMRSLNLDPEELKKELQVVGEERRLRIDNNPTGLLQENLMATMFTTHPYHWPLIGYMKDIQSYTTQTLRSFYNKFYVPNNAVLVVTGDFDVPKTRDMIEKYYSQLESRPLPEKSFPVDPGPSATIRKVVTSDVQNKTVVVAFKSIDANHPDVFALDLLTNIVGEGASSRLHKELVYKQQIASGVYVYNMALASPGYVAFGVTMKPGMDTLAAEAVIEKQIKQLQTEKINAKELEKVKNQMMTGFANMLLTIDGKARALAQTEIIRGNYTILFSELENYNKVTVEDIRRVAKTYLTLQKKVVAILEPKAKDIK